MDMGPSEHAVLFRDYQGDMVTFAPGELDCTQHPKTNEAKDEEEHGCAHNLFHLLLMCLVFFNPAVKPVIMKLT